MLIVAGGADLSVAPSAGASPAVTTTFDYTGAEQSYTVTSGVTQVIVEAQGAQGGGPVGGLGEDVAATLAVVPGETLSVFVGGAGSAGTGGFNGGAPGATGGEGGGGASDIREGGDALDDRVVVAGGGGGGGDAATCYSNDAVVVSLGEPACVVNTFIPEDLPHVVLGSDGFAGGAGGGASPACETCGGDASSSAAGVGFAPGGDGTFGNGGGGGGSIATQADPAADLPNASPPVGGGGGGGGYYGGGGGGADETQCVETPDAAGGSDAFCAAGSGGGGSGFADPSVATALGDSSGVRSGDGVVTISAVETPTAPLSVSAVPGDSAATVSWSAPASDNGSPVTGYVVTPYLAGVPQPSSTYDATATNGVVTGLANTSAYTFAVAATNAIGASPDSVASPPITIGTPTAPRSVSAVPGNGRATVSWSAPASPNGSPISGYIVTPVIAGVAHAPLTFGPTPTTHTITGLANGHSIVFRVAATNARGTGPSSAARSVVIGTPTAPRSVKAVEGGCSSTRDVCSARVSWLAPSSAGAAAVTGYVVTPYRAGIAQPAQRFKSTATTESVLVAGGRYTFTVAATNAYGDGPPSTASDLVALGVPLAPRSPSAVPGGASASVTWLAPTNPGKAPINGYIVTAYVRGAVRVTRTFDSTATTEIVTGLTNGNAYVFRVAARNSIGIGAQSVPTAPVVVVGVPPTVSGLTAVPGATSATLHWTGDGNGSPITGYRITINGQPYSPQISSGATSKTILGLTSGATYTFRVAGENAFGFGPASAPALATVGAPLAPTNVSATSAGTSATVDWIAPAVDNGSAVIGYVVSASVNGHSVMSETFDGAATTETIAGLDLGTTYTFQVAAQNTRGTGPFSAASASVTVGAPMAPTDLVESAGAIRFVFYVAVDFPAPGANGSPITGYVVRDATGNVVATLPASAYSDGSLMVEEEDIFATITVPTPLTVAAENAWGLGPPSAPSNTLVCTPSQEGPIVVPVCN